MINRGEDTIKINSTDPYMSARLDKLCDAYPDVYIRISDPRGIEDDQRRFEITDKRLFKFRRPASEAKKEQARKMVRDREARINFDAPKAM